MTTEPPPCVASLRPTDVGDGQKRAPTPGAGARRKGREARYLGPRRRLAAAPKLISAALPRSNSDAGSGTGTATAT
jgi:hypothetical protein